ncbi:bleomycin resistance protein [Gloeobacter morelensis]|uniref:Bleomycin resistance protein n=1 Tax=Gloeobacter morelensis MG652769 TaxID=2781736 RepID=A0ABY3PHI0_9CYAN|nr:VOC family protein [Gloeobacter morelensis]UFP93127.1 VOC family protein [Gloeobacter morelensis MG652769]
MFKKLSPNLFVEDVGRALDFYETVLGFKRLMTLPDRAPFAWGLVQAGGVELMFQSFESLKDDPLPIEGRQSGGTLNLYIEVDDVEALYEKLRTQVSVVREPNTTFYGMREFLMLDPDGYLLTFAQPVEPASAPAGG